MKRYLKDEKMIKTEKKTKIPTFALIFLLCFSAVVISLPNVSAQIDHEKETFAFIGATPNPVGVGQEVLLHVGITDFLRDVDHGWDGLTVTVTKPDGTTETLGPYRTDSTGGTGALLIPEQIGTYKLQTHFPAQEYFWTSNARVPFEGNILYRASESDILELVVNEEAKEFFPAISLPNEYWTRPIDGQIREWSTIAGNFLSGASRGNIVAPYNDGPETAHILWTEEIMRGGLAGGEVGQHAMEDGDAYSGKFTASVIVAGIFCYNQYGTGFTGDSAEHRVVAVDLRTGEKLWTQVLGNNERIAFAQLMLWDTFNYHGVFPYLWTVTGSTYKAYDPYTGRLEYTMTNVPSGSRTFGPNGEILIYQINTAQGWMACWNSSNVPALYGAQVAPTDPNYGQGGRDFLWGSWYAWGKTVDAQAPVTVSPQQPTGLSGYSWNVSIPTDLPGRANAYFADDKVVGSSISRTEVTTWALSLEKGNEGDLLFENTWQPPSIWEEGTLDVSFAKADSVENIFLIWAKETTNYYGFSLTNGDYLWNTDSEFYLDTYVGTDRVVYDGKLFSAGYAGIVYCYDLDTGNTLWTYEAKDKYNEILWGNNWPLRIQFITDGKIYVGMEEHSSVDPKPRGAPYFCLDINTGNEVWRTDGLFRQNHWGGNSIIGDSVIAAMDAYDQNIYAIGKGSSKITLNAPSVGVYKGSSVALQGMVTDVSPGTADVDLELRFPNGVPAVADEDMSDWMMYVYKQFPRPGDVNGVSVKLEAIDPNGNYVNIGTVTTDSYGFYSHSFEPEIEGIYTIMATFDGSGAYYGAFNEAAISVNSASAGTPIEPDQATETPLITTEVAIVIAIVVAAIVGVGAYWMLKRK